MQLVLSDADVAALGAGQVLVRDDVLSAEQRHRCRAEAEHLTHAGRLRPAGVGRQATRAADTRSDQLAWLEPHMPEAPHLSGLWEIFARVQAVLNREVWLGLRRFELQVAHYPPGGHYVRHRDTLHPSPRRRVTAILYLNPDDWRPADGGLLEIWSDDGPHDAAPVQALVPLGGRLVLFRSEAVPHAVTPTTRDRYAVTAWYRSDEG